MNCRRALFKCLLLFPAAPSMAGVDPKDWTGQDAELSSAQVDAVEALTPWLENPQHPTMADGRLQFVFGAGRATLICAPFRICTIELEQGERVARDGLHLGDTARWLVTPSVGVDATTHLMVKPLVAGLDTSMVIVTDRRTYHLHLLSDTTRFMPAIRWLYPERQQLAWSDYHAYKADQAQKNTLPDTQQNLADLNFGYDIGHCRNCLWRPVRVYDDDQRVYIQMPPSVARLQDMPILLVESGSVTGLVNYQVRDSHYIVDGLFERAWLIAGTGHRRQKIRLNRR